MILKFRVTLVLSLVLFIVSSCNKGPKVISASDDNKNSDKSSEIFSEEPSARSNSNTNQSLNNELHTVVVKEILPTTKYVYLNVQENDELFWIATRKQKINIGGTYFYKGGLLKTNFESKEHNKVFEKIYLVTSLVQANHGDNNITINDSKLKTQSTEKHIKENSDSNSETKIDQTGSIKIAELVENKNKYEGKTLQVSGKCVKINPNIMGRNWIHIKDGSKDDYDLVITSNMFVKEGSMITIKGTVTLNKDFGAGYKYDLILEDGIIVQ
jgi:hypothetical protein